MESGNIAINLKRLFAKKDLHSLIADLAGSPVAIRDCEGRTVLGDPAAEANMQEYPIILDEKTIGWVQCSNNAGAIAALVSYIATQELEKKALGHETLEKYKEITALYDITEKIAATLDPKAVALLVINEIKKLIQADCLSVMIYNDDSEICEVLADMQNDSFDGTGHDKMSFKPGEGIEGHIMLSGKAEIINDAASDPRYIDRGIKRSSLICAPLKIKEKIIGVIQISSKEHSAYTASDLKILSAVALQAAAAIENARLYDSLKDAFYTTVYTLSEAIEKRDPYTGGHTRRVMEYCIKIGKRLGLPEAEMEKLKMAAILHDIGKIGIRDNILMKNEMLTDGEFEIMKQHTVIAGEVLKYIKYFKDIIPGVKHHHERYDGSGYPEALKGDTIDLLARIIAVADTFDAMTTDRPYRKGLSRKAALNEIVNNKGTQFDPVVVEGFINSI